MAELTSLPRLAIPVTLALWLLAALAGYLSESLAPRTWPALMRAPTIAEVFIDESDTSARLARLGQHCFVQLDYNAMGYAGEIQLQLFTDLKQKGDTDSLSLIGIRVEKHAETFGIGAPLLESSGWISRWQGDSRPQAVSGATITSTSVSKATQQTIAILSEHRANFARLCAENAVATP